MENFITNQLKQHLASITQEEFAAEWAAIEDLGLNGPKVEDYFRLHNCLAQTYYEPFNVNIADALKDDMHLSKAPPPTVRINTNENSEYTTPPNWSRFFLLTSHHERYPASGI